MLVMMSVLIGLGCLAFILFLMLIWSNSWPITAGKLLNSATRMVRINGRDHYQLNVSYVFEAEGSRYESQAIKFLGGGLHKSEADAIELLRGLDKDSLTVRYCPARPTWSYLRPNKTLMIGMLVCSTLAFSGAFLLKILFVGMFG